MPNFKLTIEYDGGAYHGWQRQENAPTIQQAIETRLSLMTKRPITLIGAGRTDAGVHALGQVAHFQCDTHLAARSFQLGLNSLLDSDIVIKACVAAPETFHSRFDATSKLYRYRILNRSLPSPIQRRYAWFIHRPLNIEAMQIAARCLVGEHDFKSFEGAGSPRSTSIRHIYRLDVLPGPDGLIEMEIEANGFLRHMVRNITGSLVYVGLGRFTAETFNAIIHARNRNTAAPTAPPQGLFLVSVSYNQNA